MSSDIAAPFLAELKLYPPADATDENTRLRFVDFVTREPQCFERATIEGHVTASALVLSVDKRSVLLLHHGKLNRWVQPGGHCDGDPVPLRTAEREVQEETGLTGLTLLQTGIFDLDIHEIPAHKGIPAHLHYDVRYLFSSTSSELTLSEESNELRWVPISEVPELTTERSVLRMIEKVARFL